MNRITYFAIVVAIVAMFAFPAFAGTKTVYYPADACNEIVSQQFSSGSGDTMWHYLEILCRDENGVYTGFMDSWSSITGILGAGRISIPDRFDYVPYEGNALRVE